MGWTGALPIHSHDGGHSSRGKAPGIKGWQQRALYEGPETSAEDLKAWERKERQWPGTGIACGNVVAIDADFATDAALAETVAGPYVAGRYRARSRRAKRQGSAVHQRRQRPRIRPGEPAARPARLSG